MYVSETVCVCVCKHLELCVTFQAVLEVCELRLTERECEESAAMRRPLLFTDTVVKRRFLLVRVCVCLLGSHVAVTSW